jgi:hypothetical protein
MTHSELERELEKKGRELMRIMLQEHLNNRSSGPYNQPVRGDDGIHRTQVRLQDRQLETVEDLREQTRKAAMERTHKMGTRLSKGG